MKRRVMKVFTLVNFGLCLGGLIWLACSKRPASDLAGPSNTPVPATGRTALASLDAIVSCLEGDGGIGADGACVPSARVDGLEDKATLNDHYFAASKAAVPVTIQYRDRVDDFVRRTLAAACHGAAGAGKPAPNQQAASPPAQPSAEQLTCLRTELARKTHARGAAER